MAAMRLRARSRDTSGASRAKTRRLLPPRLERRDVSGSCAHSSARVAQNGANRNAAGITPTIVKGWPSSVTARPTTAGSAANRRCHRPAPITTSRAPASPACSTRPTRRGDAQHRQDLRREAQGVDLLPLGGPAEVRRPVPRRAHRREHVGLALPVEEVRRGHRIRAPVHHDDEPIGVGIGQWAHQDGIDDAERRGGRADANCQRTDGRQSEHGRMPQRAPRIAKILPKRHG